MNFTSESVAAGHPDKICDQISDAILDACLKNDPYSRVAVETLVTTNQIILAGEVTCTQPPNYEAIARKVVKQLEYTEEVYEFTDKSSVNILIHNQSPDIAQGVDQGGAGDQGIMFGYACNETPELMPLPIMLAHRLVQGLDQLRINKLNYLRPDGKSQVVVEYQQAKPVNIPTLILAVPHHPDITNHQLTNDLITNLIIPTLDHYLPHRLTNKPNVIVNGTGKWEIGGPNADTGLTGRKIIVDTYGGMARHGGGCFSGKDPTKVDRSAAYACRYLAKNIVAAELADRCEVKVAYVIGQAQPVATDIDTFGTETTSLKAIQKFAAQLLDLSVPSILENLHLRQPIYQSTAAYGHFGRSEFPWEKIAAN